MAGGSSGGGGGGGGTPAPPVSDLNPGVYLRQGGSRVLASNELRLFVPDYVRFDDGFYWDPTQPGRLTCQQSGKYAFGGTMAFAPNFDDIRFLTFLRNGGIQTDRMLSTVASPADNQNETTIRTSRTRNFAAGDYLEFFFYQSCSADLAAIADADEYGDWWIQRVDQFDGDVGACIRRLTAQTIPSLARTAVQFDGVEYDSGGFWSVGSPTRLTIPEDGRYLVGANVDWVANGTSIRYAEIRKNGAFIMGRDINSRYPSFGLSSTQWLERVDNLYAGDYLELIVLQYVGGGTLDLAPTADYAPQMWAQRLGDARLAG